MEGGNKHVFTKEGYQKALEELQQLKTIVREEIAKKLQEAASYGDLSENAAYAAAIEARDANEARIAELEEVLANAEIVDDFGGARGTVNIGSKVTILRLDTEERVEIQVVGASEVDIPSRKFSVDSPLVKNLVGKKVGDIVEVSLPSGVFRYKIVSVK